MFQENDPYAWKDTHTDTLSYIDVQGYVLHEIIYLSCMVCNCQFQPATVFGSVNTYPQPKLAESFFGNKMSSNKFSPGT